MHEKIISLWSGCRQANIKSNWVEEQKYSTLQWTSFRIAKPIRIPTTARVFQSTLGKTRVIDSSAIAFPGNVKFFFEQISFKIYGKLAY